MKKLIVLLVVVSTLSACDWYEVKCRYARSHFRHECMQTGGPLPPEEYRKR